MGWNEATSPGDFPAFSSGSIVAILMTASRHGDKQICSITRISFLSESPTPNGLPKNSFIMSLGVVVIAPIFIHAERFTGCVSDWGKVKRTDQIKKLI